MKDVTRKERKRRKSSLLEARTSLPSRTEINSSAPLSQPQLQQTKANDNESLRVRTPKKRRASLKMSPAVVETDDSVSLKDAHHLTTKREDKLPTVHEVLQTEKIKSAREKEKQEKKWMAERKALKNFSCEGKDIWSKSSRRDSFLRLK